MMISAGNPMGSCTAAGASSGTHLMAGDASGADASPRYLVRVRRPRRDSVTAVGDTFGVYMDREALNDYPLGLYHVTVEIVKFAPLIPSSLSTSTSKRPRFLQ